MKGSSRLGCWVNRANGSWGFVLFFSAAKAVAVSEVVVNVFPCAVENMVRLTLIAMSAAWMAVHDEQAIKVGDEFFAWLVGGREGRWESVIRSAYLEREFVRQFRLVATAGI